MLPWERNRQYFRSHPNPATATGFFLGNEMTANQQTGQGTRETSILVAIAFVVLTLEYVTMSSCWAEPPPKEVWVAVGYGGRRMISHDGQRWKITGEWSQPGKDDSDNLMGLVYAEGKFVAVGGGGGGKTADGHVLVSTDGKEWREVWKAPGRINPVVHGNGRFLVGGPGKQIYVSDDSEKWEPAAKLTDRRCTHFRHGAFGNGVFVLTGNNGGNSPAWVFATEDGRKLSKLTFDIPNVRDIVFADGTFVLVGKGVRLVSKDGVEWEQTGLKPDVALTWAIYTGDRFLCGGGGQTYSSKEGRDWVADPRRFRGTPKWTDGKRIISTSWPGKMYFSLDAGKSWSAANELTPNGINRVVQGATE